MGVIRRGLTGIKEWDREMIPGGGHQERVNRHKGVGQRNDSGWGSSGEG